MMRVVMITEMSWQVNEEVSRDMTGEADRKNPGVDSTDGLPTGLPHDNGTEPDLSRSLFYF